MKGFGMGKAILNFAGLFLLIGVIGVGVAAMQNPQIFKPRAASEGAELTSVGNASPPPNVSGAVKDTSGVQEADVAAASATALTGSATAKCTKTANLSWPHLIGAFGNDRYEVWLWQSGTSAYYMKGITYSSAATVSTTGPGGFKLMGAGAAMPALKLNTAYYAQVDYIRKSPVGNKWGNVVKFTTPAVCN